MLYLIVSIVFLSATAVFMRTSVRTGASALALNLVYRGAVATWLAAGLLARGELGACLAVVPELGWLGVVGAACFWLTGLASLKCVELGPLGASWTILRCSMLVPVAASILIWRELSLAPMTVTAALRLAGVALGVVTVLVCGRAGGRNGSGGEGVSARWALWMAAAFASQGAWEICLRATRDLPTDLSRSAFLLVAFAASALLNTPAMLAAGDRVNRSALGFGLLLGVCALLGTGCRVLALKSVDGIVVFPATTVAVIIAAQLAGRLIWNERNRYARLGAALGVATVLLLTLDV